MMKKYLTLTTIFILFLNISFGQIKQRGHSSLDGDFYIDGEKYHDGFRVYSNLTKNDSINILKDIVSKLNGKWTSTQNNLVFVDEYELSETTFKGKVSNPDIIIAAPLVRLEFINGQVKIISTRTIGQAHVDDDTLNISVSDNELNINNLIHHRQKPK
jgi:hypothetical protein